MKKEALIPFHPEKVKAATKVVGNIIHSVFNWFDATDMIGDWTKKHSEKELIELKQKLVKMSSQRLSKIEQQRNLLHLLESAGMSLPINSDVANKLREKVENVRSNVQQLEGDHQLAEDISSSLEESYTKPGKLGDHLSGLNNQTENEKMYKEVLNNVQEKFSEEKI